MEEKNRWQIRASKWFCALVVLMGIYLLLKYAIGILIPFVIAWGIAALVYPLSKKTSAKIRIPQKLCAALYVILILVVLALILFFTVSRLAEEVSALMGRLSENGDAISVSLKKLTAPFEKLLSSFPFLFGAGEAGDGESLRASVDRVISDVVSESVSGIGARLTEALGRIIAAAPGALIAFLVTLMSCFYLSMDYEKIRDKLIGLLPESVSQKVEKGRRRLGGVLRCYARAYLLLFLLTFAEIFIGLLILRRSYAFLLALVIAVVDILPVLGTGTVLIPWAIVMLISGQYRVGLGLLILYGIVTIVREIAEPHLIGGSLGIHPLASLFFMFAGLKLFGLIGMLLGPFAALLLKELVWGPKKAEAEPHTPTDT